MNLHVISSGSSGNCYCINNNGHLIFIDAGVSLSAVKKALCSIESPKSVSLFVTHEHQDHISGIIPFIKYYSPKVYTSEKTSDILYSKGVCGDRLFILKADVSYDFNNFSVRPFNIIHDAAEPFGYRFDFSNSSLSIATDFGTVTDNLLKVLENSDNIVIESNYEEELLMQNKKYPNYLKKRIASHKGHLSNKDAFFLVGQMSSRGLKRCFLAHVSENSNDYSLLGQYANACRDCYQVNAHVLRQHHSEVFEL